MFIVSLCAGTESGVPSSESNTVTSIPAVEREANLLAGKEAKEAKRARRRKMIKLQLQHNSCPEAKISPSTPQPGLATSAPALASEAPSDVAQLSGRKISLTGKKLTTIPDT